MPNPGPVQRPAPRVLLSRAAVVLAVATLLGFEVYDLDVWWHLAIGGEILSTRAVPTVDRWTVLGQGRPYHDSHWLFQALLAAAHGILGMPGLQLLAWSVWGACLAAVWRLARRTLGPEGSALLTLLVAASCLERMIPRPEVVSYAALAWMLLWLAEGRGAGKGDLVRFGMVQAAWTNAHGLFVLGPFAAACHLAAALARRGRGEQAGAAASATALAATLAGSLASPFGLGGWRYAGTLLAESAQRSQQLIGSLGEMSSPFAAAARLSPAVWAFGALLLAAAVAAVSALRRGELSGALLFALALAPLSATGRRNVALFAVGVVPLLAAEAARWRLPRALARSLQAVTVGLALGLAWASLSGWLSLRLQIPARWGLGATPSFFPHALPAVLAANGVSGGVLASNSLGGFVAFHGGPRVLPLTDGRWEIYDANELTRVLAATRTRDSWRAVIDRYSLRAILLAHTSPEAASLLPDLAASTDWRLVFYDAAASLWLPAGPRGEPGRSVDPRDPASLPATRRTEDAMLLATFLAAVGARPTEIAALRRGLDTGRRSEWFLERLGFAELAQGHHAEAESAFRRLLAVEPGNEAALNELAFLAYRRRDLDSAVALLSDLVRRVPENAGYRENLERVEAARRAGGDQSRRAAP